MPDFALSLALFITQVIFAVIVLLFGLFFLAILCGCILGERARKRLLVKLVEQKCPSCDTAFGLEVALKARKEYQDRCEQTRRQNPGSKINFFKQWSIKCPVCQYEDFFDLRAETLGSLIPKEEPIDVDNLVKHIRKQTKTFPKPVLASGFWHPSPPGLPFPLDSQHTPFDTCRLCLQTLVGQAYHLANNAPPNGNATRVVVAIHLPNLNQSQIVVFFRPSSFKAFFERNTTTQTWTPLEEERSLAREWKLQLPPGFAERGITRAVREPDFERDEEIWFIGQLESFITC